MEPSGLSSGAGSASAVPAARGTAQPWGSETAPHAGSRAEHHEAAAPRGAAGTCPLPSRAKAAHSAWFSCGLQGESVETWPWEGRAGGLGEGWMPAASWHPSGCLGAAELAKAAGGGRCPRAPHRCLARAACSLQLVLGAAGTALSPALALGLSQTSHCHLPAATKPLLPQPFNKGRADPGRHKPRGTD